MFGLRPDPDEAKAFLMDAIKKDLQPGMVYVDAEGVYDDSDEMEESHIVFRADDYKPDMSDITDFEPGL